MAVLGAKHHVLICVEDPQAVSSDPPCYAIDGVQTRVTVTDAYVLGENAEAYIDALAAPFDYTVASGFFGFSLITILLIWWWSHSIGAVWNLVKRT